MLEISNSSDVVANNSYIADTPGSASTIDDGGAWDQDIVGSLLCVAELALMLQGTSTAFGKRPILTVWISN